MPNWPGILFTMIWSPKIKYNSGFIACLHGTFAYMEERDMENDGSGLSCKSLAICILLENAINRKKEIERR